MSAPVALAQRFVVDANLGASPPAPGVLQNDTVPPSTTIRYGDSVPDFQDAGSGPATTHQNGAVLLQVDGSFKYTPPSGGLVGDDYFRYLLSNGDGKSAALVTLSPGNPPVVSDSSFNVSAGVCQVAAALGVLTGARNGGTITSYGPLGIVQTQVGQPAPTAMNGKVWLNADGSFTYVAASGFSGTDSFRFIVANGNGATEASVTLNVAAQGNVVPPRAAGFSSFILALDSGISVQAPGLLTNCQLNGAVIVSYGGTSGTENTVGQSAKTGKGSVTVHSDGSFDYSVDTFASNDSFVFVIANPAGSASATVSVIAEPASMPH